MVSIMSRICITITPIMRNNILLASSQEQELLWWDNKKTLVLLQGFLTKKIKTKINTQLTYLLFQLNPHKIHLQSWYVFPLNHLTNELHNSP